LGTPYSRFPKIGQLIRVLYKKAKLKIGLCLKRDLEEKGSLLGGGKPLDVWAKETF